MSDCIFCQIVTGAIPSYKIYEDENFLAFLDISQIVDGHTLVIPKKHCRWIWDLEDIGGVYKVAQKNVKKMQQGSGEAMVVSVTIGNEVPHAHLHLLPKTEGSLEQIWAGWRQAVKSRKKSDAEMKVLAQRFSVSQ